eukprot:6770871-Alexandrium_andersonii.AAC.1
MCTHIHVGDGLDTGGVHGEIGHRSRIVWGILLFAYLPAYGPGRPTPAFPVSHVCPSCFVSSGPWTGFCRP